MSKDSCERVTEIALKIAKEECGEETLLKVMEEKYGDIRSQATDDGIRLKEDQIPGLGIVGPKGEISAYPKEDVEKKVHHSFILDEEDMEKWERRDDVIKFIVYNMNIVGIKGGPTLEPFERKNYERIQRLSRFLLDYGLNPDTRLRIEKQQMDSRYEGEILGTLEELSHD